MLGNCFLCMPVILYGIFSSPFGTASLHCLSLSPFHSLSPYFQFLYSVFSRVLLFRLKFRLLQLRYLFNSLHSLRSEKRTFIFDYVCQFSKLYYLFLPFFFLIHSLSIRYLVLVCVFLSLFLSLFFLPASNLCQCMRPRIITIHIHFDISFFFIPSFIFILTAVELMCCVVRYASFYTIP